MTMKCKVCAHPDRKAIERQIVAGVPLTTIAREYQLHRDALMRHRDRHLAGQLRGAATRSLNLHTQDLLQDMTDLMTTSKEILESAMQDGHRGLSLKAIKEIRNNIETLGKIIYAMHQQDAQGLDQQESQQMKDATEQIMSGMKTTLSPLEISIYQELATKLISGDPDWKIQGINYDAEPIKDVVPLEEILEPPKRMQRTKQPATEPDSEDEADQAPDHPLRVKPIQSTIIPGTEGKRPRIRGI